jgi:hypothetical protein
MAVGETAKLIATLELKDKFTPTVKKAIGGLGTLDKRIDTTSSKAHQVGQHVGIGIQNAAKVAAVGVGILATQVALGLNSLVKLEQAQAQTAAVIKSTGGAAGVTAEQVGKLAEKYESLNATVGDEVIRSAENLLLTFTNVKDKAFEPALEAILDMNTAMGKGPEGLQSTVIQVGKALNDPTKGITALRKAGVAFTDQQVDQIKALQKSGDLLGAQKIVLGELNKEFGGSFLAQGGTTGAKVAKFGDAIEDLQRTLAAGFLPVVSKVADKLSLLFQDPAVVRGVEEFGTKLAGLFSDENLATGANVLKSLFQTAKDVAPAIAAAAEVTGAVVKTAVQMFTSLPKELQTLLVGGLAVNKLTGGLVTNLAGGLISSVLKQLVSGVVNVQGGVVNVVGPAGGLPGAAAAGAAKGGLSTLSKVFLIGEAVALVATVEAVRQEIAGNATEQATAIETQTQKFIASQPSKEALQTALDGVNQGIKDLKTDPLNVLVQGDALAKLEAMRADLSAQLVLAKLPGVPSAVAKTPSREAATEAINKTTTAIETMRGNIGTSLGNIKTATVEAGVAAKNASMDTKAEVSARGIETALAAKNAGDITKAQIASAAMIEQAMLSANMATIRTSGSAVQGSVRGVAPPIVGAIQRNRPIITTNVDVHVTAAQVTKSTTTQSSYGPGNGSSGQPSRPYGTGPLP